MENNNWIKQPAGQFRDHNVRDLREKYGYEGYGIYIALKEVLRLSPEHRYPLSKLHRMSEDLAVKSEWLLAFILDLAKLDPPLVVLDTNGYKIDTKSDTKALQNAFLYIEEMAYLINKQEDISDKRRRAVEKRWANQRAKASGTNTGTSADTNVSSNVNTNGDTNPYRGARREKKENPPTPFDEKMAKDQEPEIAIDDSDLPPITAPSQQNRSTRSKAVQVLAGTRRGAITRDALEAQDLDENPIKPPKAEPAVASQGEKPAKQAKNANSSTPPAKLEDVDFGD